MKHVSETRRNSEEATCQPSPPGLRDSLREPPRGSDELGAGRRGTRERHASNGTFIRHINISYINKRISLLNNYAGFIIIIITKSNI